MYLELSVNGFDNKIGFKNFGTTVRANFNPDNYGRWFHLAASYDKVS